MEILTIILIMIILLILLVVIYNITKLNKEKEELNALITELQDINEFKANEIERCYKQIENYEKEELKVKTITIGNKEVKKNFIYQGKRVLVGDYEKVSYENTLNVLRSYGITVDIVTKGTDIVDKIRHGYKCDLIFTNNIYKEGYDGPIVLQELKQIDKFKIPVVVHTVSRNKRNYFVNECGFDDYIEKPLDQENVKKILNKYLGEPKTKKRKRGKNE